MPNLGKIIQEYEKGNVINKQIWSVEAFALKRIRSIQKSSAIIPSQKLSQIRLKMTKNKGKSKGIGIR